MKEVKQIQDEIQNVKKQLRLLEPTREEKDVIAVGRAATLIWERGQKLKREELDFLYRLEGEGKQALIESEQRAIDLLGNNSVGEWLRKSMNQP